MSRLRYDNLYGTLGAPLTNAGTTLTFAAAPTFANGVALPAVASPDFLPISIDERTPSYERVWITAYAGGGATTATILRGQENTSGVVHGGGANWECAPGAADLANVAVLKPLPSHSFTATSAVFASIGHTVTVTTQSGIVLLYYVSSFQVLGSGTGGLAAAIFVDGTKITGAEDSAVADAKLTMAGITHLIYVYTDGSDGGWALPSPFNAGFVSVRTAGQRGLNVAPGMAATEDGAGQVNPGSPIMLSLTAGTRTIDIRYAPTAPNPPTVSLSGHAPVNDYMVAVGF